MSLGPAARTRLTTAMVLVLVTIAGGVIGVALERQLEARGVVNAEIRRQPPPERGGRGRDTGDRSREPGERRPSLLIEQVGLSETQMEMVDSIVGVYRDRMRSLHEEFNDAYMSRYREILDDARSGIKAVLDEGQRAAYDSILVEWDRRRSQRRADSASDSGGHGNEE